MMVSGFIFFRCAEERLGGDATNVQACAAERFPFFGNRDLHPELRATNGADISAGAGANNDDVECI